MYIYKIFLSGMTVSSLVLFPLINALTKSSVNLHWAWQDNFETILFWIICGSLISASIFAVERYRKPRWSAVVYLIWFLVGIFFASGALIRLGELGKFILNHRDISLIVGVLLTLLFVGITSRNIYLMKADEISFSQKSLYFLAPLNILVIFNLFNAITSTEHDLVKERYSHSKMTLEYKPPEKAALNVILLFDELSVDYVYGDRAVSLPNMPFLRSLRENSSNFTNAYLVGGATERALSDLFNGGGVGQHSFGDLINSDSFNARVIGWHLDYCHSLASNAKKCSAINFYNVRTLNNKFSIFNPILTSINLLPFEKPYGFLKIPFATLFHRNTYLKIKEDLIRELDGGEQGIIFAHINVPHTPFLSNQSMNYFDRRRFGSDEGHYTEQFQYIDSLIGDVKIRTSKLAKNMQVNLIVLSDHNLRAKFPEKASEHVVLMFSSSQLNSKVIEIDRPVHVGDFISSIVTDDGRFIRFAQ